VSLPYAFVLAATPLPATLTVSVRVGCPFCSDLHVHGVRAEDFTRGTLSSRSSDCAGGDYQLVLIPRWDYGLPGAKGRRRATRRTGDEA